MKAKLHVTLFFALIFLCMKPALADYPFTEDFEGGTFPPAGWSLHSLMTDTPNWVAYEWLNHTPGGTTSAYHESSPEGSVDNWLVTPLINVPADGHFYLTFWSWLANNWAYKKNSVLVSTGSPNPADDDFVEVWTITDTNNAWDWYQQFVNLEAYAGQDIYIAFRYEGDPGGHIWYVDDIAMGEEVDDSPVLELSTMEIHQAVGLNGTGSKTFEVINAGILDLTFDIEIEFVDGSGWVSANPLSGSLGTHASGEIVLEFDAAGLDFGTYQANIIVSGNDPQNPTATLSVTLEVVDVNVYPFTENFDSETFPPIGWTIYDVDGDETKWAQSWYNNTPEGQFSALHSYSGIAQDGWLVTPQITVPEEGFFYLSFWSMVIDTEFYVKNSVLISTGSGNPADDDFAEVWTVAEATEGWSQHFINIEEFAGQDIFIAFRYEGEFAHLWAVDDISLGEEIDDAPIMIVNATEIQQTVGENGSGAKTFKVINDGVQNLDYEVDVVFTDGDGWLTVEPASGSIPAKSGNTVNVSFDASGLDVGQYQAEITVSGNDTENPSHTVLAILDVMEAQPIAMTVIYDEYTFPTSISSDGRFISGSQFGGLSGYLWEEYEGTQDILGEVHKITDNGLVVGTYDTEFTFDGIEIYTAGIWDRATQEWQFLGMNPEVPEFFGTVYNSGYGITADGELVVGMQWYPDWTVKAFKWTEEDGYEILAPDATYNTRANGVSDNGEVIFGWAEPDWVRTPVIWYNDEMIFIDQTQYGEAMGVSPNGDYVTGGIGSSGFIWSSTEGVTLFDNSLNQGTLSPQAILDDGTVFGYTSEGFPPTPDLRRAFVRNPDGTMETFNEYAAGRGWFDAADWIFFSINDVTPDGNKFIGAAELPGGEWISFVVDFNPGTPIITINPLSLSEALLADETASQTITIENTGTGDLSFSALVQYTQADARVKQVPQGNHFYSGEIELATKGVNNAKSLEPKPENRSATLNYDGDNYDAVGLMAGGTFYGAARFSSELTSVYENYQLESVDVYISAMPTALKLIIWDAGTTTSPGAILHEQVVTPVAESWNNIQLSNPLTISGADLWIGFEITHDQNTYGLGVDAGPADLDGGWISIDAALWERLVDYDLNSNWNIRGNLSLNGMNWLALDTQEGVIFEGESQQMAVAFDALGMESGTYNANIRVSSNDTENPLLVIPVTLEVSSGVEMHTLTLIANPADAGVVTGNGEYEAGTTVTVNATPHDGYQFLNWTDPDGIVVSDVPENSITISGDLTLTANFQPNVSAWDVWETSLRLYPNPASDFIDFVSDENIRELELFNLTGQKVYGIEVNVNNYKLDVSAIPEGIYMVRLTSVHGHTFKTRIVIAR